MGVKNLYRTRDRDECPDAKGWKMRGGLRRPKRTGKIYTGAALIITRSDP